jgi:hypothetical protein
MENMLSRTGLWMTVAIVLVAGFMYWLYAQSSSIEATGPVVTDTTATAETVSDTSFAMNPLQFARRRIVLGSVTVAEVLGRAALTLELPGRSGYPVILDRTVLGDELRIVTGDNLALGGCVYALNDSILDVWVQRGFFEPENRERMAVDSTFFLVDSLDFVFPGAQ